MNRRKFITAVGGAAIAAPLMGNKMAGDVPPPPMTTLGNTGIKTTRMAMGTGMRGWRMQSNFTRAGFDSFVSLFRHAYDRGIRFYDLADMYGSHIYFRDALRFIPRNEVTILTKFNQFFDGKEAAKLGHANQKRSAAKAIARYLLELGVDEIDVLLMHCVTAAKWDEEYSGYLEAIREAKAQGKVRSVGMSAHTLKALSRAADLDWIEIALTRINPEGVKMDGDPAEVIPVQQRFKARGAGVIGMKIYGEGKLTGKREECMKFAQNLGYLDAMTIGAETAEQIDDNLRLMAKFPAA